MVAFLSSCTLSISAEFTAVASHHIVIVEEGMFEFLLAMQAKRLDIDQELSYALTGLPSA
jgi:hypothetical protein